MRQTTVRRIVSATIATGIALFAHTAQAVSYCSGNVNEILMMADGKLMVHTTWRNDWMAICSARGTWNNISTEVCMSWYGMVTTAKIHSRPILIYYTTDVTCATLATYENAPVPSYVRLQ